MATPTPDGATATREAVAIFRKAPQLEAAIDALLTSGFDRADVCLLASEKAVTRELGHLYQKVTELEDDRHVPRECYVAREDLGAAEGGIVGGLTYVGVCSAAGVIVASGGTLVPAIVAAALGGGIGAAIGSALAHIVDRHYAEHLEEQLRHGGLLLWVRTHDSEHERRAVTLLTQCGGADVHVHGVPDGAGDTESLKSKVAQDGSNPCRNTTAVSPSARNRSIDIVEEAGVESFPASDAPVWTP